MSKQTEVRRLRYVAAYRAPTKGDPKWYVELPNIEGCFSSGDDFDDAQRNIEEALISHSLNKPLTVRQVMQIDNEKMKYAPAYKGYEFKMGVTFATVSKM